MALETTFIKKFSPVGDANRGNWNPVDGLLYHHAGDEAWSNTVTSLGYLDRQYLETYDLDNDVLTPIINANPAPSDPPPNDFPTTGLPAPRPSWVLPDPRRTVDQTDGSWRDSPDGRGENEYHGLRGLTWSQEEQLFYASDEHGLFKVTPTGDSLRVGAPDDGTSFKGISFYRDPETGEQTLYAGERKGNFLIHEVDPETAQIIRSFDMTLFDDNGTEVPPDANGDGIVSLAQHPVTGELYGLTKNDSDNQLRKLFTLDPNTGIGLLIGTLETSGIDADFASLTFAGWLVGDINGDGEVNGLDVDPFVDVLLNGSTEFFVNLKADINGDGEVNGLDVDPFVAAVVGGGAQQIPEPSTLLLCLVALGLVGGWRKRAA